jgi:hypothetical protein
MQPITGKQLYTYSLPRLRAVGRRVLGMPYTTILSIIYLCYFFSILARPTGLVARMEALGLEQFWLAAAVWAAALVMALRPAPIFRHIATIPQGLIALSTIYVSVIDPLAPSMDLIAQTALFGISNIVLLREEGSTLSGRYFVGACFWLFAIAVLQPDIAGTERFFLETVPIDAAMFAVSCAFVFVTTGTILIVRKAGTISLGLLLSPILFIAALSVYRALVTPNLPLMGVISWGGNYALLAVYQQRRAKMQTEKIRKAQIDEAISALIAQSNGVNHAA